MKTKKEIDDELNAAWRKGFEMGMAEALRQNNAAFLIGSAVLNVLDRRYESAKEDY